MALVLRTRFNLLTLFLTLFSFLFLIFVQSSFAFYHTTDSASSKDRVGAKVETKREALSVKRDEQKLKACQTKEKVIKTRLANLVRVTQNMGEKFTKITDRVKTFYADKVVPKGGIVANYDALVADVNAKKAAADAALATAKANGESFSCTSSDPKGTLTQFRKDMQAVKRALKDYRTSVKNLIVAVKQALGEVKSSPSPTP